MISAPEEGYVLWQKEGLLRHSCRIVHRKPPCNESSFDSFDGVHEMIGDKGLALLLSWIDKGEAFSANYKGPKVKDLREWAELVRRLHLPYYEEARRFWGQAKANDDLHETTAYLPDSLRALIERYGGGDR
ncbi:hypothetical protein EDM76_01705 [bacterium]|nr:MAG: hypothetical protein EDM76_01705 [bacterium]MCE7891548.1 hypothetical protein [Sorangiineae bacterium PRO1]